MADVSGPGSVGRCAPAGLKPGTTIAACRSVRTMGVDGKRVRRAPRDSRRAAPGVLYKCSPV